MFLRSIPHFHHLHYYRKPRLLYTLYIQWDVYKYNQKILTFQYYANSFNSKGSTLMFELSKYFSQTCLEIYQDKMELFSP